MRDNRYYTAIPPVKRTFKVSPHAMKRLSERKAPFPDFEKLTVIDKPVVSKVYGEEIKRLTLRGKNVVVYFSYQGFIYVAYTKKAAHYTIITVL